MGPTHDQHRANMGQMGVNRGLYTGGMKSARGVNNGQTGAKNGENRELRGGQQGVKWWGNWGQKCSREGMGPAGANRTGSRPIRAAGG